MRVEVTPVSRWNTSEKETGDSLNVVVGFDNGHYGDDTVPERMRIWTMRWFAPTLASLLLTNTVLAERLLLDSGRDPAFWTPVTGGEYPGATASVDVVSDDEVGPCVRATCTFARESRYAGLQWRGFIDEGEAVGFRVKPLHRGDGVLRIKDATGQWLAGTYKAKKGVWTDVRVPLEAATFTSHWGGANDGKVHLPVRVLMIAGWRGPDAQELRVSSLYVERTDPIPPEQTWRVEVHPGVSLGVAFPDEPAPYRVVVTNRLSTPGRVAVQAVRQAPGGREEELLRQELDIDGWSETSVALDPSTSAPGYWRIGVRLSDAARGVRSETVSGLAVVPVPRHYGKPAPECYFGMQIIKDLAVAERLGVKAVRQFVFWRYTEGREGHPGWGGTDKFVEQAQQLHMDTMLTLVLKAPTWAGWELAGHPGAKNLPDPARLPEWRRFVRGAAERYRDRVQVIEIENEPDLTCVSHPNLPLEQGAEYYARFLAAGAAEVRKSAPNLTIAGLDVSGGDLDRDLPFTRAVLGQAGQWLDLYTGHPYASPRQFAPGQHPKWPIQNRIPEECRAALDAMQAHGRPRRMRIGELGWCLRGDMDPLSRECLDWSACVIQSMICAKIVPGVEKYRTSPSTASASVAMSTG